MNNLKSKAGFTLVELIVVIAILAILAGVGTAAYTGYIEKAKEAKDVQVLSNVNTAFAAACAGNSVAPSGITVDDLSSGFTGITVTAIGTDSTIDADAATPDANDKLAGKIQADFNTFFGTNSNTLEYYSSLDFENGNFKGTK